MSVLPQKRTLELGRAMSAMCQKRTHALQQSKARMGLQNVAYDHADTGGLRLAQVAPTRRSAARTSTRQIRAVQASAAHLLQ
jgi:hypothetical protein